MFHTSGVISFRLSNFGALIAQCFFASKPYPQSTNHLLDTTCFRPETIPQDDILIILPSFYS
jgi:hypothetical protein